MSGSSSNAGASRGTAPWRDINSARCAPVRASRIATVFGTRMVMRGSLTPEQAGRHVDCKSPNRGIEQKGDHLVNEHHLADGGAAREHVGGLAGGGNGEREVREIREHGHV